MIVPAGARLLMVSDRKEIKEPIWELTKDIKNRHDTDNEADGIKFFMKFKPHLVIASLNDGGINGLDIARKVKKMDEKTCFILICDSPTDQMLKEAMKAGVNECLSIADIPNCAPLIEALMKKAVNTRIIETATKSIQEIYSGLEQLIVLFNDEDILKCNNRFLEFFGCKDIAEFLQVYGNFGNTIAPKNGYAQIQDDHWLPQMLVSNDLGRRIILKNKGGKTKVFLAKIQENPDEDKYVISFTDISEIDAKLNGLMTQLQTQLQNQRLAKNEDTKGEQKPKGWMELLGEIKKEHYRAKRYDSEFGLVYVNCIDKTTKEPSKTKQYPMAQRAIEKFIRPSDSVYMSRNYQFLSILTHTAPKGCNMFADRIMEELNTNEQLQSYNVFFKIAVISFRKTDSLNILVRRLEGANSAVMQKNGNAINYAIDAKGKKA